MYVCMLGGNSFVLIMSKTWLYTCMYVRQPGCRACKSGENEATMRIHMVHVGVMGSFILYATLIVFFHSSKLSLLS